MVDRGIMSRSTYDALNKRGDISVVRRGSRSNPALVAFDSLPIRFQKAVGDILGGDPRLIYKAAPWKVSIDYDAFQFFSNYRYEDGSPIPTHRQDNILLWSNNASILNTIRREWELHVKARAAHGRQPLSSAFFKSAVEFLEAPALNAEFPNNLPTNVRRLKQKMLEYMERGYECLVKRYAGNSNARKVTSNMEKLILALYAMPEKPYGATVHELYTLFLSGDQSIIDKGTGEIFSPENFRKKDGTPIGISEATILNYVNKPSNRVLVDRLRNDAKFFRDKHEPHHHRLGPEFSLSKISMDDRDIPNSNVKAYYAYDITSGAIIGKSYAESASVEWVVECLRDMFAYLDRNELPVPMEVEVETFLMNRLQDTVMKEGSLFKYIRWCAPGNSQEKWAETGNRLKKLGVEKVRQKGIGRFYAKLEANRPKQVMEWDDEGRRVKDRTRTFAEAVAEDLKTIELYNAQIPKTHQRYAGQSRNDILFNHINPQCMSVNPAIVARQIGRHTETSIMRSQYVTVQYERYALPAPAVLDRLAPNNWVVDAYYLPDTDGNIERVFLYQKNIFIAECARLERYNTARAERTDTDTDAMTDQAKYISKFRSYVKEGKNSIPRVQVMQAEPSPVNGSDVELYIPRTAPVADDAPISYDPLNDF